MTKPRTKYPIESFGPALMQALVKGGREKVVLKFDKPDGDGKRLAHNFQRRIHTLRQRMRAENHPDYMIATRARVSILWGERAVEHGAPDSWSRDDQGQLGALILIRPQDEEFIDVLSKAGIEGVAPTPTQAPIIPLPHTDALEDLLADLDNREPTKRESSKP